MASIFEIDPLHPISREKILNYNLGTDPCETKTDTSSKSSNAVLKKDLDGMYLETIDDNKGLAKKILIEVGEHQRNFCFNILLGCEGPNAQSETSQLPRSKKFAPLKHAISDIKAVKSFLSSNVSLFTDLVFPLGGRLGCCPFSEDLTILSAEKHSIEKAAILCREFFRENYQDPEWCGGQINLVFSGHGNVCNTTGNAKLVFTDYEISASEIIDMLELAVKDYELDRKWINPNQKGLCKLNLILDCCHSAAFAIDVFCELCKRRGAIAPGDFRSSCLPHQKSFEYPKLGHGIYSYSFLQEQHHGFLSNPKITTNSIFKLTKYKQLPIRFGVRDKNYDKMSFIIRLHGSELAKLNPSLFKNISETLSKILDIDSNLTENNFKLRTLFTEVSDFYRNKKINLSTFELFRLNVKFFFDVLMNKIISKLKK